MDKDAIKKLIAEIVASIQGCKLTELPSQISRSVDDSIRRAIFDNDFDFPDLINQMVAEGMLVEVEYVLPKMDYRTKSFILPGGTLVGKGLR